MNFVKVGDSYWNLGAIARVTTVIASGAKGHWADWVVGVITLASGKEFGISEEDYTELELAIEKQTNQLGE